MLLYYITDRKQFGGTADEQRRKLLDKIDESARAGVDYIQLREKDLTARELERLASEALQRVRVPHSKTKLLINSRIDMALALGAHGVHLTSTDIPASEARAIAARAQLSPSDFTIAVSCHSEADVRYAESHGADFVVVAPIFEKVGSNARPLGIDGLRKATGLAPVDNKVEAGVDRSRVPVLALGGVTLDNARHCVSAGAAGVAGIRLFQASSVAEVVHTLSTN